MTMRYLHLRGTLIADAIYVPRAGYESDDFVDKGTSDTDLRLVLVDKTDHVLATAGPIISAGACAPGDEPAQLRVTGCLPLHPKAAAYEVRRGDITLHRCGIGTAPAVDHLHPRYERKANVVTIDWKRGRSETLRYSVLARMDNGRQFTLSTGLTGTTAEIDLTRVPASGTGRLLLVVNDGVRSSEVEVMTFDLEPRPTQLHVLSPGSGSCWPFGEAISVVGVVQSALGERGPLHDVTWHLDGQPLASGRLVAVVEEAAPGPHTLTLTCGESPRASVGFVVEEPDAQYAAWMEMVGRPERGYLPDGLR